MASQSPVKRQRDETQTHAVLEEHENTNIEKHAHAHAHTQDAKRQKSSYNDILSLLDEEEDEPTQDISSLITTLQQELSSENIPIDDFACDTSSSSSTKEDHEENEDDKESVMRHLLEASDDELGLPYSTEQFSLDSNNNVGEELFNVDSNAVDGFPFGDGLWEFEDEAANYYTMLHSELFL